MRAELRDSLENLFPDSVVGATPCRRMSVDVARGGTLAVHVLLNGLAPGARVAFEARLDGKPSRGAEWSRLVAVPVEDNTGLSGFTASSLAGANPPNAPNPYVIRRAPFLTYDAMEPVRATVTATEPTLALRFQMPITTGAQPGTRDYTLRISADGDLAEFRLTACIHPAVIPPVGRASFPYTNWFSFENIASRHGLTLWTEPYWRMLKAYAELMARGRQNTFLIPLPVIFEMTPRGPLLNRARLRRIVRVFTDAGLYFIEGGHVASRTGGEWNAATFDVTLAKVRATTPDGHAILVAICRQLMEEIDTNRWAARWIQHATDEPVAANAADYRILVGMVHKYMPGLPILDATMDPALVGSVDIWCPQVQEYQAHREAFEAQRALGDRVWFYTCCFPGGPWLNRLLDQELLRPALFGWAAARFRLDGFLHWGFNQYRDDQDPFRMNVIPNWGGGASANALPAGDTHVVYPGDGAPWSGLRFEAQREGCEDYELLAQLHARSPRAAAAAATRALQGFDQYVKDVKSFRAARRALLKALARR